MTQMMGSGMMSGSVLQYTNLMSAISYPCASQKQHITLPVNDVRRLYTMSCVLCPRRQGNMYQVKCQVSTPPHIYLQLRQTHQDITSTQQYHIIILAWSCILSCCETMFDELISYQSLHRAFERLGWRACICLRSEITEKKKNQICEPRFWKNHLVSIGFVYRRQATPRQKPTTFRNTTF